MRLTYHETVESFNEFLTKPDLGKSSDSLGLTRNDFQKYLVPFLATKAGWNGEEFGLFSLPKCICKEVYDSGKQNCFPGAAFF